MKCSFCEKEIEKGKGKLYAKKDGKTFYFCTGRCETNMIKLGRKARQTKWTQQYQKNKEIAKGGKK